MPETPILFRQLFDAESCTYTYLVADSRTREGVIIDPVREQTERDLKLLEELGIQLRYVLDTHVHADHITGAHLLREATGAKTVVGRGAGVNCADVVLGDGDTLRAGGLTIRALATPGHTDGCTCYHIGDRVFTGDTLLIRGTGRTDFQQGSAELLFRSVREKLFRLPEETLVYPAHDYRGMTCSSIGEEKRFNPRLREGIEESQFVEIMKNLKLPPPKKLQEALPANLQCGRRETEH